MFPVYGSYFNVLNDTTLYEGILSSPPGFKTSIDKALLSPSLLSKEWATPCKKPRGGQKLTWIKQIEKDLEKVEFITLVKTTKMVVSTQCK